LLYVPAALLAVVHPLAWPAVALAGAAATAFLLRSLKPLMEPKREKAVTVRALSRPRPMAAPFPPRVHCMNPWPFAQSERRAFSAPHYFKFSFFFISFSLSYWPAASRASTRSLPSSSSSSYFSCLSFLSSC
jgi:hypothetical protein